MTNNNIHATSMRSRLQAGFSWSLAGAVFNSGCTLALNIIVARIVGKEVFGEFGMVQNTMATLAGIAQLSTGYTANKYVAEFRSVDKDKVGRIIGLCSVISTVTAILAVTVLFVGAPFLATVMFQAPHLSPSLMIATGMVFFAVMNGYQTGALAGMESYGPLAKALFITGSLNIGVCSIGAWLYGLNGIVAALGVSSLCQWLIHRHILKMESSIQDITIYSDLQSILQEKVILVKFLLPAAISGFVTMPALWLANTFLVRQPAGFSQMALFSAAGSLRALVLFLPLILNKVSMSLLNNQKGLDDDRLYRKVFWSNLIGTAGLVFAGTIVVAFLGPWLLSAYGKDFGEAYPVLIVILLAGAFEGITQASYQIIQSREKLWLSLWTIALPRDGAIVVLAYFLTPHYGAIGLAWAYAAAWLFALVVVNILTYRIGLAPNGTRIIPSNVF